MPINTKNMAQAILGRMAKPSPKEETIEFDPNQGLETAADALLAGIHSKSKPAVVQALKDFFDQYESGPEEASEGPESEN